MLLMAIQVHDVGNLYGREEHELKTNEALVAIRPHLDDDTVVVKAVRSIAEAHGGSYDGDKDKLELLVDEPLQGEKIRTRLLAALLRFADELADDYTRASRFQLAQGVVPAHNEIYHQYAAALHSVEADKYEIRLHFVLHMKAATEQFGKGEGHQYLLDYVIERALKMHYERIYCMRVLRKYGFEIDQINVRVSFFDERGKSFHDEIGFRLREVGYPSQQPPADVAPELCVNPNGECWTGELLKRRVENNGAP